METRCVLCNQPTGLRAIGAMIVTGNMEQPDSAVLCRRCAALPPQEQQRGRDLAMARMLRAATTAPRPSVRESAEALVRAHHSLRRDAPRKNLLVR